MKQKLTAICLLFALCFGLCPAALAGWSPPENGIELSSESVYFCNLNTGAVLYEKNADELRSPASLTKMMTCLLLLESGADLDTTVTVPERLAPELELIQRENGADVGILVGEEITLRNLLTAALLPSANDAASVIADTLSGGDLDAFVAKMNARAAALGCQNTTFNCVHGLYDEIAPGNWSTARDMAKIALACYSRTDFMQVASTAKAYLPITNLHTEPKPNTTVPAGMWLQMNNVNLLLDPEQPCYRDYIGGLKTGFTDRAGRCLATTATRDGETWLLVEMGCPNEKLADGTQRIYAETVALFDWALDTFSVKNAVDQSAPVAEVPVLNSVDGDSVALLPMGSLTTLCKNDEPTEYRCTLPATLIAPVAAGETVGTAEVVVNGQVIGVVRLVTDRELSFSWWQACKTELRAIWRNLTASS